MAPDQTRSRLETTLGTLTLDNPVMPASGCFGPELAGIIPTRRLGAVVTKTVFPDVRSGNPAHRLGETPSGMINAVGIPSLGTQGLESVVLPGYRRLGPPVIVSIGGLTRDEYVRVATHVAELLATDRDEAGVAAVEVNLSCPNLEHGGLEIGADPDQISRVVGDLVEILPVPVLTKLTPNVTSIGDLARAAEDAGSDALTVANTFVGMSVDIHRRRPLLGNGTGGVSGPAIKPLALRAVYETARAVAIPIVGCGGITTAHDVAEFLLVGASAVQVGTGTFTRPDTMIRILDDLPGVLDELEATRVSELIGALTPPDALRQRPPGASPRITRRAG